MRIASGVTDQYVYFVAVDATDFTTRETGLSSWTVYRSRNGGAAAAMTTPTINETDTTNMPGVYELLCDEDMTIDAGDDSQEMAYHITHAGMAPVTRTIELYRPKITAGNTLDVTSTGAAGIDWANVENPTTAVDLSGTDIQLCDTVTTLTGHTAQTGDSFSRIGATGSGLTSLATQASVNTIDGIVDAILLDTAEIGTAGDGLTNINLPNQTMDITGNLSGSVGSVTGAVGSVTGAVGSVTGSVGSVTGAVGSVVGSVGSVTGAVGSVTSAVTVGTLNANVITAASIAAAAITDSEFTATGSGLTAIPWNAAWDAEVESEVNDAIDTAISELGVAAPTATPTLRTGLMLLYMALRNQLVVQTSGTDAIEIYNDAGTKIASKLITDDGSDYTEAEMS